MNPCGNLKKYGLPATLVGILAEHPATSGSKIHHFRSFLLPASPSSAAMPVQHDKSRMQHDLSNNPNRPSSTGIGLSMCQDLQLNSAVFTATSAIDAGGIHRGRRPVGSTENDFNFAATPVCCIALVVPQDISCDMGCFTRRLTEISRIQRPLCSQTFAVKAEACFGYLWPNFGSM